MKKIGSMYVLLIPLVMGAILLTAVVAMRLIKVKTHPSSDGTASTVPTLSGSAGKPKTGFDGQTPATFDLWIDFAATADDGSIADFHALQQSAAQW